MSGVEYMMKKKNRYQYYLSDGEDWIIDTKDNKDFDLCMPIGKRICDEFNKLNDELVYWKERALHKPLVGFKKPPAIHVKNINGKQYVRREGENTWYQLDMEDITYDINYNYVKVLSNDEVVFYNESDY